jgi:hypothetical protein
MTDAFTKYVKLVRLANKKAATFSEAIFDKWISCFGVPFELIMNLGTELCAKLTDDLFATCALLT